MASGIQKRNGLTLSPGGVWQICKQHLCKDQPVYIEGRLQTRVWEDANGNKRSSTEIVAKEMIVLGESTEKTFEEEETDLQLDEFSL